MVNYFITYCIFTSLFLILWYHGKIVVPGREHGVLIRILRFHAKGIGKMWILSFVLFFGFEAQGPVGPGYTDWWYNYTADHSTLVWFLVTPAVTTILWFIWHSTFTVMIRPGTLGWWEPGKAPSLHRVSMALPAFWGLVFYSWLLFSPCLPFYSCYVRTFVLHSPVKVSCE